MHVEHICHTLIFYVILSYTKGEAVCLSGRNSFRNFERILESWVNPVDTFFKLLKEKSTNKFCHKTRPTVWPEPISFSSFEKISNDFQKKWMFHRWQVYKMTHIFSTFPIFTWTLKSWTWRPIKNNNKIFRNALTLFYCIGKLKIKRFSHKKQNPMCA